MRQVLSRAGRAGLALGVAAALALGAACGSDGDDKGGTASSGAATRGAVDASGAITVVAKDNLYEPKEITGPGGQKITVKLDNQGAAIHNFAIKDQKVGDAEIGAATLVNGKQTGTVEFTLPAGSYEFYCSVHPVEMRGKLTLT